MCNVEGGGDTRTKERRKIEINKKETYVMKKEIEKIQYQIK